MRIIQVIALLSLWSVSTFVFAQNSEVNTSLLTLKGKNLSYHKPPCFLYVDEVGKDPNYPGPNKFFAKVRTSFQPEKSIYLVTNPRKPQIMFSVDEQGHITRELQLRLRGKASFKALVHASDFKGVMASELTKELRRFACVQLRPVLVALQN